MVNYLDRNHGNDNEDQVLKTSTKNHDHYAIREWGDEIEEVVHGVLDPEASEILQGWLQRYLLSFWSSASTITQPGKHVLVFLLRYIWTISDSVERNPAATNFEGLFYVVDADCCAGSSFGKCSQRSTESILQINRSSGDEGRAGSVT